MPDSKTATKSTTNDNPAPVPRFDSNDWLKAVNAAAKKLDTEQLEAIKRTKLDDVGADGKPKTTTGTTSPTTSTGTAPAKPSERIGDDTTSIRAVMDKFAQDRQAVRDAVNKEYEEREKKAGGTTAFIDATLSADGRWFFAQRNRSATLKLHKN